MTPGRLREACEQGLAALARAQNSDGSFWSYSSADPADFREAVPFRTTFITAMILSCLEALGDQPLARDIGRRAADFLVRQAGPSWSFNYWARESDQFSGQPYPDDLDDTSCALAALAGYDAGLISAGVMAKAVKVLMACEVQVGGPYYTWLAPRDAAAWKDVDLAVNANVANFLATKQVYLPNLQAMAEQAIAKTEYASRYYPMALPVMYFLARWYRGELAGQLRDDIEKSGLEAGHWGTPLETALAASALMRLGAGRAAVERARLERAVAYLLVMQGADGWPAQAFCLDPAFGGRPRYAGAAALTTAMCLEALGLYGLAKGPARVAKAMPAPLRAAAPPSAAASTPAGKEAAAGRLMKAIASRARREMRGLDPELRGHALAQLERLQPIGRDIMLVPYVFQVAMGGPGPKGLARADMAVLGQATLYGWMAYTIYDDFLDGEGDPQLLGVANVAARRIEPLFRQVLPGSRPFHRLVREVLDGTDAANAWELAHCRAKVRRGRLTSGPLPDFGGYERLAERSLGHALGPLAIVFAEGYNLKDRAVEETLNFFRHYLIARQISDDLHDWDKDLERGQLNPVSTRLLAVAGIGRAGVELSGLIHQLRARLWEEEIEPIGAIIREQCQAARQALENHPLMVRPNLLSEQLAPFEQAVRQALERRAEMLEFVRAYRKPER